MRYAKTNVPGLMRDTSTNAVINMNMDELKLYREQINRAVELNNLRSEMNTIKSDVSEIKDMLRTIAQAVNNGG